MSPFFQMQGLAFLFIFLSIFSGKYKFSTANDDIVSRHMAEFRLDGWMDGRISSFLDNWRISGIFHLNL